MPILVFNTIAKNNVTYLVHSRQNQLAKLVTNIIWTVFL